MHADYAWNLVAASYAMACVASYGALDLGGRLAYFEGWRCLRWLSAGAVTLGSGIWSMHFVGMDALRLQLTPSYDLPLVGLSWLVAVGTSALALLMLSRRYHPDTLRLIGGGTLMGGGMFATHLVAMLALRAQPALQIDPLGSTVAAGIAVLASIVALFIYYSSTMRELDDRWVQPVKLSASLLMAAAICGMHYISVATTQLAPGTVFATANPLRGEWISVLLGVSASGFALLVILLSIIDAQALHEQRRCARERIETERLGRN